LGILEFKVEQRLDGVRSGGDVFAIASFLAPVGRCST